MTESNQCIYRIFSTMDSIMEKDFNMIINNQKPKIMVYRRNRVDVSRTKLTHEIIKEVEKFSYLDSKITSDSTTFSETVSRTYQEKI